MWDLDTLRHLNEQAYLSSLKMVNGEIGGTTTPTKPESGTTTPPKSGPVYPLALLASKLIVGPPALIRLIDIIEASDSVAEFLSLVRELLPDYEVDIMAAADDSYRIERFCHYFSNQYFPLEEQPGYDDLTISDFIRYIPVSLMGYSWEDQEMFNDFREGFVLLLSMVESPFDNDERLPILERVKELVGKSLVELIPPNGWELNDIHRMFDGSVYEGVVAFADWIHSRTGCMQLDANYAEYGPEMWSTELVNILTGQWPTVVDLQDKMQRMYVWLEEDLYHNFEILLAIMMGREIVSVPKEQMSFPLDDGGQVIREEVIENG
ncbi:hypothetical protein ES703_00705 [subsurface metagenome]